MYLLDQFRLAEKEFEQALANTRQEIEAIAVARAKLKVQLLLIDKSVGPLKTQMEDAKVAMAKLAQALKTGEAIQIDGKTLDAKSLKMAAVDAVKKYKAVEAQVTMLEKTKLTLEISLGQLQAKREELADRLPELEKRMMEISGKRTALAAALKENKLPVVAELVELEELLKSLKSILAE